MNIVFWNIGTDGAITPQDSMPPMPDIPRGAILVIGGRGPVWRYGMAFHMAHGSAAGAVATYDPRLGAVVVASHIPNLKDGDILADVNWPY